jgi:type II secretory pathway pseudopilin PulG
LIELIGVLAIMGILASMAVPPILRQIRQAQTANEDANLNEVARAIVEGIKVTGTIPNPNVGALAAGGWATISLPYTALGTNQLLYVSDANANTQRRMYLSGGLTNYFNANGIIPPFATPALGWPTNSFPPDLQLVLVSSSREDLLLSCSTTANLASNDVVWLKNWVKQATNGIYFATNTAVVGSIANSTGTWTNKGEFLHVKTVDLRPLFCRVELIDTACPPTATINIGTDTYLNPNVQFFANLATFNIYDSNLAPIAPARIISNTDLAVLMNPTPQFINRTMPLNLVNMIGRQNVPLSTQSGATPVLNPQPRFRIPISGSVSPPVAPAGGMFPANVQTFYVLKGTSLQLWDNASGSPVLTTTIESDSSFKYLGSTWTRVD